MKRSLLRGLRARTKFVFSAFLLGAAILAAHLFFLQSNKSYGAVYLEMTSNRWNSYDTPYGRRGSIYFRDGALLAGSRKVGKVIADPQLFTKYEEVSRIIADSLGIDALEIEAKLRSYSGHGLVLAEGVPLDAALRLDRERLRGIFIRYNYERFYPYGRLGAPASVGYAGRQEFQRLGIEHSADDMLTGTDGMTTYRLDADSNPLPGSVQEVVSRTNGSDVVTTLQSSIQLVCEDEMNRALQENQANMACLIVMQPDSGEVLAASTYPAFDPNDYVVGNLGSEFNVMVHRIAEPGSTLKPLIAAYALDRNWIDPDKKYVCNRSLQIGKYRITEAEQSHYLGGNDGVTIPEIIINSSNIGMAQVAMELGAPKVMDCLRNFGFFGKTGIELPVESAGLKPCSYDQGSRGNQLNWPRVTLANVGFGQGLAVTPIQLATAYSIIANGGYKVAPTLILEQSDTGSVENDLENGDLELLLASELFSGASENSLTADSELILSQDKTGNNGIRVISEETSATIRSWLEQVVDHGTGKKAQLKRYRAAGKTGTAQIPDPEGGYKKGAYLSSFAGYFPAEKPKYVVLVMFWEPRGAYYGGAVAAPVFKAVCDRITHIDELIEIGVAGDAA